MTKLKRKKSNTCLAVIRKNNKPNSELIFAGDRRISWGMSLCQIGVRPKVIKRNGVIFAGTGSAAMCDLICELSPVPDVSKSIDGFNYIHRVLFPELRSFLISKGYSSDSDLKIPDDLSASVIIGVKHELFEIDIGSDTGITVDALSTPYASGCGGKYALGSLKTTESLKMKAEERLKMALFIAAELSPGCDANIDIVKESDPDSEDY